MGKIRTAAAVSFLLASQLVSQAARASGGKAPGGLDQPTQFQLECRKDAADKGPIPVIFGFDGLNAYDEKDYFDLKSRTAPPRDDEPGPSNTGHLLWGMIAHGILQVPGKKDWYYFDQTTIDGKTISDPVRCAYEWAHAHYAVEQADGRVADKRNTIVLMGFSYGGHAVSQLSAQLDQMGEKVDLIMTADPRTRMWVGSLQKSPSTAYWANFYQTNEPFMNGYQVKGADHQENLSKKGYWHENMPRSPEVRAYVIQKFSALYQ